MSARKRLAYLAVPLATGAIALSACGSSGQATASAAPTVTPNVSAVPVTEAATTTTAPAPAAPAVDPLTAWKTKVATTMSATTVTSGLGLAKTGPVALALGEKTATVWAYAANEWTPTATIDVDEMMNPQPITVADVTGDGTDDFVLTWRPNHTFSRVIVGDGGTWRTVNFEYPESNWTSKEPVDEIGSVDVGVGGKLWSNENPCIPSCADATTVSLSWRFDGDHFVVSNPDAVKDIAKPKPASPTATAPSAPEGTDHATVTQFGGRRQSDGYVQTRISWVASNEHQYLELGNGVPIEVYPVPGQVFSYTTWTPYRWSGSPEVFNPCTSAETTGDRFNDMLTGDWCAAP